MLDKMTSVSLQLLALLVISHISGLRASLLVDQPPATDTQLPQNGLRSGLLQSRSRRKVPESVDTSPPVEYMTQLRDSLTGSDGNPSTATDDPTSVWCLLDKDLLGEVHRPKPSNGRCRVMHQFRFSMRALSEIFQNNNIFLQKGILRTYVDVIPRYFRAQTSISVNISSVFSLTLRNNSTQTVHGGQDEILVTPNSSEWTELNVTQGLKEIQSLTGLSDTIELRVTMTVDCTVNRKVPVTLADPASVPLSQGPRRQRLSKLQPMLLVYLSDEQLKAEIQQEADPQPPGENIEVEERKKRGLSKADGCHLDDFLVNFHNIDLIYVLAPYEYNAKQCVGSCAHSVLRHRGSIATNHAKIMASAVAIRNYNPLTPFHHQPTDPCCVPTKYGSLSLLILDDINELNYAVYPTMSVSACGCR